MEKSEQQSDWLGNFFNFLFKKRHLFRRCDPSKELEKKLLFGTLKKFPDR